MVSAPTFVPPQPLSDPLPQPEQVSRTEGEPYAAWVRELLWTHGATTPRANQRDVGPSELGMGCSRRLAFRLGGVGPVNLDVDPMASLVGTAMHDQMARLFANQRPASRFLVEHRVSYRGVSGTLDLYDRRTHTVIDWKFSRRAKITKLRSEGPPRHHNWQLQTYAAGLVEQGETPQRVALVYLPIDAGLDDVTCWVTPVNIADADDAIERLATVRAELDAASGPGDVPAQPSRLCPWCPHYRPTHTGSPHQACPGGSS